MRDKISSFKIFSSRSILDKPISDSTHSLTEISFLIVRIQLENGIEGEAYLLSFQYSRNAIIGALKDVGEFLVGKHVNATAKVLQELEAQNEYFGREGINQWAMAAYNIAMWDAWGKVLSQPVWKIFGTSQTRIPVYGSGGWISYSVDELLDEVSTYKNKGFKAVKIKVGKPDWQEDLERLKLVRENLGSGIEIMMDANQGMSLANALRLAEAARDMNITWFEEPIDSRDVEGYKILREKAGISIAMGEREYSLHTLKNLLNNNALDLWQPDILRIGGVERWRESASLARIHNASVLPHFYKEYDVPLLCTITNGFGSESFNWVDTLIDNPISVEDGIAKPNEGPGWGFKFKDGKLEEVL
ncbi:mandelate racemase/muconate lactonizing enzyme family protein [Autumnicola musiva]|uniref:Mandelate racemase/muconate lactonizing enzyme family protein n=1 Tax=Autumnicola musiva TaxID=3075589 RepID=A0ABU3D7W9_9FLAO|nr:mandelate racemase/muconate lactonizing enzyme family protein [Zunongwangia sp. F117]MDT0677626.1 mandelate racemase/muconate lactonizing enzyme family protein [Zunongwangia sp. F117]